MAGPGQPSAAQLPAAPAADSGENRRHLLRFATIWILASVVITPIVYFVAGPILPPSSIANNASDQRFDNTVLATVATPVLLFVWIYLGYALVNFRQRGPELEDGPPIRGHAGFQATWIGLTSFIVLSLFVFGTYELVQPVGAGTGSGANPIWVPAGYAQKAADNKVFQVQVIGQQWRWTFRYPQYSGVETTELEIPVNTEIQFNVTSLDVIHSFWALELGVKADANPGSNDIAFVKAAKVAGFHIHCAELCGTLHGAMTATGQVVSRVDFKTWISGQVQAHAADIPLLPPYSSTYLPAAGADQYYDPGNDPQPQEQDSSSAAPSASGSGPAPSPSGSGPAPSPSGSGPAPSPSGSGPSPTPTTS